jgi:hypothetical protein
MRLPCHLESRKTRAKIEVAASLGPRLDQFVAL